MLVTSFLGAILQLKKFQEYEKMCEKQEKQAIKRITKKRNICFEKGVMLLEAAARNDVPEG